MLNFCCGRAVLGALAGVGLAMGCAVADPPPVQDLGLLPGDGGVFAATNSQQDHHAARGGSQVLVAWTDYRARSAGSQAVQSDGDVYGVRLDAAGNPVDAAPFLIAGGMGLQQRPQVAWNGENWLVLYISQDPVGGYYEDRLRAVRVSPQGQVLDATPIVFPPSAFTPDTIGLQVAGQNGQWLLVRCLYHADGYGTYLAGQRMAGNGQLLDATPLVLIDWVYGQTRIIASNGEYLAAGQDWNDSAQIKARRIGLNGQPLAAAFSVPGMILAGDGAGYYVAWIANYVDLVGSPMSPAGALSNPGGTMLVPNFAGSEASLAHDGTNWRLAWGVAETARTMRIGPAGNVLDPGGLLLPIVVTGSVSYLYNKQVIGTEGGNSLFFWHDFRAAMGSESNVFAMPVSASNVPGAERCVSTGTRSQRSAALSAGPMGTAALALVSEAANDDRVVVQLLDGRGAPAPGEPVEVTRGPNIGRCGIAWNGSLYMIVWDEGPSGLTTMQIRARRMNADGTFVDAAAFDVMPGFNADVGSLGEDFLVAGARYGSQPQYINLWGSRIDGPTGARQDGASGVALAGGYVSGAPRVRSDGVQWLVCAHSMWTHDSSQGDAILARVPSSGPPAAAVNPTPYSGGTGDLDIAFSGSKYLLVWRSNSLSNANNYISGRIMNADGTFPPGSFVIAEAPGRQLRPAAAWNGAEFVVTWEDQRGQESFFDARTDIYGARVSESGAVLDAAAFAIQSGREGEAGPAVLALNGITLVASTRMTNVPPMDSYRVGLSVLGETGCNADYNQDGGADNADVTDLANDIASGTQSYPPSNPDFNRDGGADNSDVIDLANVIAGGPCP